MRDSSGSSKVVSQGQQVAKDFIEYIDATRAAIEEICNLKVTSGNVSHSPLGMTQKLSIALQAIKLDTDMFFSNILLRTPTLLQSAWADYYSIQTHPIDLKKHLRSMDSNLYEIRREAFSSLQFS